MAGQYALPKKTPLSAGVPPVSPSAAIAHELLDTPAGELVRSFAPQYLNKIPPEKAKQTFREVLKTSDFMTKSFIMSIVGQHLPKGVTAEDISKAVNEKPPAAPAPTVAAPAPAPAAPAAAAPAAPAAAPAAAAAPAPAATAPAIADVIAPPAPATRGPTTTAAAAMPTGADAALDYIAKHGGHASVLRNGKIVDVHPGEKGSYKALSPELAARLHAAGVAYERATGEKPKFGELSRGEDVQGVYYGRYKSGQGGIAAAPGRSRHQHGEAGDLPDSNFRKWLYAGNAQRFGLHFPVKGDTPHVQADPAFKGRLATGTGAAPGTVDPSVAAGAGPAAVAAAQAADAKAAAAGPSGKDPNAMRKAFLATIATGEAPKGAYDYIIGGQRAKDLSQHPNVTGSAGRYGSSTAAGQYQFLKSTWDEQAAKYGYKDFKPETQDTAAWNYAKDVYKQKSGRDLETDLASGDPKTLNNISATLGQTWTSLPGGTQPNSNWKGKDFASVYSENLKGSGTTTEYPDPTPNVGAGESAYPAAPLDPTPNVGAGAGDYTPTTSPGVDTSTAAAAKTDYGKGAGDIFSAMGDLFSKGPVAQNAARPSGPANLPVPILPVPPSPYPTVDPRVAQAQRQQLAMALQRLNSGKLV